MSAYREGIEALAGCATSGQRVVQPLLRAATRYARANVGDIHVPYFATPAQIQGLINQLLAEIARTDSAVSTYQAHPQTMPAFLNWRAAWSAWATTVRSFLTSQDWLDRFFSAPNDQIESYSRELGDWQQQFLAQFGGMLPGIMPVPSSVWRSIGIGVAAGLATAGIIWLIKGSRTQAAPVVASVVAP